MKQKVVIEISLGNDECQTGVDVIGILAKHQGIIWDAIDCAINKQEYVVRTLIDRNGNTVGKMEVINESMGI